MLAHPLDLRTRVLWAWDSGIDVDCVAEKYQASPRSPKAPGTMRR